MPISSITAQADGGHECVAVERAALIAVLEAAHGFVRDQRADRQAAAKALRQHHDVRRDARMLEAEELAGAADAGLDLVEDQQDAVLVAQPRRPRRNSSFATNTPASPWIGSSITATVLAVIAFVDGRKVVQRHLLESPAPSARTAVSQLRLAGGRHRGERAAVEAVLHGDDLERAVALFACPTCARA